MLIAGILVACTGGSGGGSDSSKSDDLKGLVGKKMCSRDVSVQTSDAGTENEYIEVVVYNNNGQVTIYKEDQNTFQNTDFETYDYEISGDTIKVDYNGETIVMKATYKDHVLKTSFKYEGKEYKSEYEPCDGVPTSDGGTSTTRRSSNTSTGTAKVEIINQLFCGVDAQLTEDNIEYYPLFKLEKNGKIIQGLELVSDGRREMLDGGTWQNAGRNMIHITTTEGEEVLVRYVKVDDLDIILKFEVDGESITEQYRRCE